MPDQREKGGKDQQPEAEADCPATGHAVKEGRSQKPDEQGRASPKAAHAADDAGLDAVVV
jgi:hypothetical protein